MFRLLLCAAIAAALAGPAYAAEMTCEFHARDNGELLDTFKFSLDSAGNGRVWQRSEASGAMAMHERWHTVVWVGRGTGVFDEDISTFVVEDPYPEKGSVFPASIYYVDWKGVRMAEVYPASFGPKVAATREGFVCTMTG